MRFLPYCFILVAIQSACVLNPKPLDIEIEEPPQKLVISSFAIPPQELAVTLTRTFSALLGQDSVDLAAPGVGSLVLVDSALVTLTHAGRTDTLRKITPALFGGFTGDQRTGEPYLLRVKDYKTGLEVQAETFLLDAVSLDTVYPAITSVLGDTTHTFQYRFRDQPGAENYYLVTYTHIKTAGGAQVGSLGNLGNLGSSLFKPNTSQFNVFSDQTSGDGKDITFKPDYKGIQGDTMVVALSNIPKGYYEFLSAYKRSGNLFSQLISEPINLPTNVEGGFGYFAMIRPRVKFVILK